MLKTVRHLLELIRFSHTLFALPFAMLAGVMAWRLQYIDRRSFCWQEIVGLLLCMVAARSFAMAFNRYADRHIDAKNPRTAGRHLPAGILEVSQVTAFAALSAVGFVLLGYWRGPASQTAGDGRSPAIGTSGAIDMEKARERGAEMQEQRAA